VILPSTLEISLFNLRSYDIEIDEEYLHWKGIVRKKKRKIKTK